MKKGANKSVSAIKAILGVAIVTLTALGASADDAAYTLVNKPNGYSFIQINQDLDSFSFTSDFKSISNSGKVGYVVYGKDLSDGELGDYLKANSGNAEFAKKLNDGLVDLGALKAGDRVGFYLERNNGSTVYSTEFVEKHGTTYLEFEKNGSGKDEWMPIGNVKAVGHVPSGAPLPGLLAMLLVGGAGAGSMKLIKRRGKKA